MDSAGNARSLTYAYLVAVDDSYYVSSRSYQGIT